MTKNKFLIKAATAILSGGIILGCGFSECYAGFSSSAEKRTVSATYTASEEDDSYKYVASISDKKFDKDWYATIIDTSCRTFKIGFNTAFFDEDLCYTYHKDRKHKSIIKNSQNNGTKGADPNKYAKLEIRHYGGGKVFFTYYVE